MRITTDKFRNKKFRILLMIKLSMLLSCGLMELSSNVPLNRTDGSNILAPKIIIPQHV